MSDLGLLGAGHQQVLGDLNAQLAALAAGDDRPRVVVLQGASGVGKSRIVRELYRWWVDHQPAPGYWPPLPEIGAAGAGGAGLGSAAAALANRKVIGPPTEGFTWPAESLPAFTWWSFNCGSMSTGDAVEVVAQARPAVQAHLPPVILAWRRSTTVTQRLGRLDEASAERFRELVEEGRDELIGQALDAMGVVVPGLGLVVDWATRGVKAVQRRRAEAKALARTVDLGAAAVGEQQSAAVQLAEMILAVVCPSLPAVVVVEDIHLMGPAFAEFLQVLQVRNPARPVLIVGTAWPEAHDRGAYAAWRDAALTAGQLVLVDVPDLPATDLREFVYQAAPNSSPADVGRLIGHYPNPLALQLFLGLDSTRRRITRHHGALPIKAGELAGLPREDVRDLYRAMWLELPEPVRRILTLAAGVLPPHADLTWPFLPEIVTDTGITTGDLQAVDAADTVTRNLQAAVTVHHWVVPTEPHGTYRFREAVLDDVAAEGLDPTDRTEITAAAIACLRRWIDIRRAGYWQVDPERADEQTALVGRWLWRLIPTDGTVTEADLAGGYLAARLLGDAHQPAAAHDLMNSRPWRSTYPADHQAPLMIRSFNGTWLGDAGRVDDAITEFGMLLADQHRIHGPDHPNTLTTRNNLAIWLGQAGRLDAAITELQVLLADQHRIHGPDHPNTLTTRNNLASLHGHAGRLDAAIAELQVLLADQHRIQGPDHPSTLTTRCNLVAWIGESGQVDEAIIEARALLADQLRVQGPDHSDTLATRNNLAHWLGESGRVDEAVTELQMLLADLLRVHGPDHPHTMSTRNNLAIWLGESGQVDEAITQTRALLEDRVRVLGPDHPHTLTTRNNLAHWLGESGRVDEAITALQALLEHRVRVLGPDHPHTLTTRNNLAHWLRESGQVNDAITALQALLADQLRVLGPDHPHTLTTGSNLVTWLGRAGQLNDTAPVRDAHHDGPAPPPAGNDLTGDLA